MMHKAVNQSNDQRLLLVELHLRNPLQYRRAYSLEKNESLLSILMRGDYACSIVGPWPPILYKLSDSATPKSPLHPHSIFLQLIFHSFILLRYRAYLLLCHPFFRLAGQVNLFAQHVLLKSPYS